MHAQSAGHSAQSVGRIPQQLGIHGVAYMGALAVSFRGQKQPSKDSYHFHLVHRAECAVLVGAFDPVYLTISVQLPQGVQNYTPADLCTTVGLGSVGL